MEKKLKYLRVFVGAIVVLFIFLYSNGDIGTHKSNVEKEARISQKIPDHWKVSKDTTETTVAMLFYNNSIDDHTFSIYVNRSGLSVGYFFRGGGSSAAIMERIAEFHIHGYNECIYLSMNKQQIAKVEIDKGNTIETIEIDSTKPFAFILPVNAGSVSIYDINGKIIKSVSQYL